MHSGNETHDAEPDRAGAPCGEPCSPGEAPGADPVRLFFRKELKYEMGRASALFLREEIARHLPLFEFRKGYPCTHIATLYYDSEERSFYRAAEADYDNNVKVRVKDYYYTEPPERLDGACFAKSGGLGEGAQTSPVCYVELKKLVEGRVVKKRFALPKQKLARLEAGDDLWEMLREHVPPERAETLREVYRELSEYLRRYRLKLTSIVTYRRVVYQADETDLRITFDDNLLVHAPVENPYRHGLSLTPALLGPPLQIGDSVTLEIKSRGAYPEWLGLALRNHPARRLSKFTSSVRRLTGCAALAPEVASPAPAATGHPAAENGTNVDETQDLGGTFY